MNFNKYVSLSLIFVFILHVSMNTIVFFKFKATESYISEKFCVNRNNPSSTCFGKCYLKSQLQKSNAKEKQIQSYSKNKIVLFFEYVQLDFEQVFFNKEISYSCFLIYKQRSISFDIFHPPSI